MSKKARNRQITAKWTVRDMSDLTLKVGDVVVTPDSGHMTEIWRIVRFVAKGRKAQLIPIYDGSRQSSVFMPFSRVRLAWTEASPFSMIRVEH